MKGKGKECVQGREEAREKGEKSYALFLFVLSCACAPKVFPGRVCRENKHFSIYFPTTKFCVNSTTDLKVIKNSSTCLNLLLLYAFVFVKLQQKCILFETLEIVSF